MKLLLLLILQSYYFTGYSQIPTNYKISTFHNIPQDMMGCGSCYYLTNKDKKTNTFLCMDNGMVLLIMINDKAEKLAYISSTRKEVNYSNKHFTVFIKIDQVKFIGDENSSFKGSIVIKSNGKIIYNHPMVGNGGC